MKIKSKFPYQVSIGDKVILQNATTENVKGVKKVSFYDDLYRVDFASGQSSLLKGKETLDVIQKSTKEDLHYKLQIEIAIRDQNAEIELTDDDNLKRIDNLAASINKLTKQINRV